MRSPGRPIPARSVEREFWRLIANGKRTEEAAEERERLLHTVGNLTLTLNTVRQATITREMLDITGGVEALRQSRNGG